MVLKNICFKLMNNLIFGKTMENLRKDTDIKHVTIESRRNYLVSQPNCHTAFFFSEYLLAIRIKKLIYLSIKLVYLGFAILEIIKAVTCVS